MKTSILTLYNKIKEKIYSLGKAIGQKAHTNTYKIIAYKNQSN